jgi:hypothetical protein
MRAAGMETTAQAVVFFWWARSGVIVDVGWAGLPAHAFNALSHTMEHAWFERVGGAAAHPTSADQAVVFFLVDRECGWRCRDGRFKV